MGGYQDKNTQTHYFKYSYWTGLYGYLSYGATCCIPQGAGNVISRGKSSTRNFDGTINVGKDFYAWPVSSKSGGYFGYDFDAKVKGTSERTLGLFGTGDGHKFVFDVRAYNWYASDGASLGSSVTLAMIKANAPSNTSHINVGNYPTVNVYGSGINGVDHGFRITICDLK